MSDELQHALVVLILSVAGFVQTWRLRDLRRKTSEGDERDELTDR